jgi:hypothetical protein
VLSFSKEEIDPHHPTHESAELRAHVRVPPGFRAAEPTLAPVLSAASLLRGQLAGKRLRLASGVWSVELAKRAVVSIEACPSPTVRPDW